MDARINVTKQEITSIKRRLKLIQKDLKRSWDVALCGGITDTEMQVLEQKERRYRTCRRKLEELQSTLRALQSGTFEPVRVKPWTVSRPANETFIIPPVEA